jgi:transcription antitermination factor NusA-like protein
VPDDQLSLAIGKEGQNARLAAKLTGCKIDIAPASQAEQLAPETVTQTEPEALHAPLTEESTQTAQEIEAEPEIELEAEPEIELEIEPETESAPEIDAGFES